MVLQSKVFLIVLLQKYSPSLSKRKTLIKRMKTTMKTAMNRSVRGPREKLAPNSLPSHFPDGTARTLDEGDDAASAQPSSLMDIETGDTKDPEITQTEAMRLFTKIPFPVPKRVIHIKPRTLE
jgi:hypothetical protein